MIISDMKYMISIRILMNKKNYNPTNDSSYGEIWITTNAHQNEPYPDGTSRDSGGYHIHLTSTTNTNGCLGIHDEQLMNQLIDLYTKNQECDPGTAKLIVKSKKTK